jgi:hypothetical protein
MNSRANKYGNPQPRRTVPHHCSAFKTPRADFGPVRAIKIEKVDFDGAELREVGHG